MSTEANGADGAYFAAGSNFDDERCRLRLLEEGHDPVTVRNLARLGVGEGWHCLEVGAGGGSIAGWLAERVGPSGRVVATDVDLRFLDHLEAPQLEAPQLEVRRHDIVTDAIEEEAYDLVHCRGLLFHMRLPEVVATKLVGAVRPGGWVLIEEADLASFGPVDEAHPLAQSGALKRMVDFARSAGIWNPLMGRRLAPMLVRLGLTDVDNEVVTRVVRGGDPMAVFVEKSYQRLDEVLLGSGVVTKEEVAERSRAFGDPAFWFLNHMMVSAWGRIPS